jgi:hypothetical protein
MPTRTAGWTCVEERPACTYGPMSSPRANGRVHPTYAHCPPGLGSLASGCHRCGMRVTTG